MSLMCPGDQKIMKAFPLYVSQRHSPKKARVTRDSSIVAHHEHFPLGRKVGAGANQLQPAQSTYQPPWIKGFQRA